MQNYAMVGDSLWVLNARYPSPVLIWTLPRECVHTSGIELHLSATRILRASFGRGFQDSSCISVRPPEVALLNKLVFENLRQRPVRGFVGSHPPRVESSEAGRYPSISL